jgi:hypothetical protein
MDCPKSASIQSFPYGDALNLDSGASRGGGSTKAGAATVAMSWTSTCGAHHVLGAVAIKPARRVAIVQ